MNLETFFEKFDLLAEAPGAVEKMRELVLLLAVRGKLVEGKKSDGEARRIFPAGLPREADPRYEVPENWLWVRFAAVGEQRLGKMLDQRGNRGDLKPYLRNTNVQWMAIRLDDIKELRLEPTELQEYRLLPGDLLICEGGEPGRCAIWRDQSLEMYFQKALHRVRPRKGILSEFLAICLQVDARSGDLAKHFTGATIKHFTGRSLSEYSIALPPLAEQRRIVAKVDELMALCDRLEVQQKEREARHATLARASLERFAEAPRPEKLNFLFHKSYSISPTDLRKSILTIAFQGLLAPSALGSASWVTVKLKDLTTKIGSGSTPAGGKATYQNAGVPLIRSMNVHFGGFVRDGLAFLDSEQAEKLKSVAVEPEDVLLNITGASIGRVTTAPKDMKGARVNQHVCIVRPTEAVLPDFLRLFLASPVVQSLIDDVQVGATREALTKAMIEQFEVPVPSIDEQGRIVAKVKQVMALVDELERQLSASRSAAASLLDALVAELVAA